MGRGHRGPQAGQLPNTAVGVAMIGGRAGYAGKVAEDELGEVFVHDIRAAGVELGNMVRVKVPDDPSLRPGDRTVPGDRDGGR